MVTEELGDVLDIRSLAATGAGAGEFEQRLGELSVLHIRLRIEHLLVSDLGIEVVEIGLFCNVVKV